MNRSKEIEAEWISLAPGLSKSSFLAVPFRVPEGYFQGFFARLMNQIHSKDEIESISPLLAGLPRKTPYQVPDDYFARFRVSDKIATDSVDAAEFVPVADFVSSAPVIAIDRRRSWMRIAVAAVITAVILTGAFFFLNSVQPANVSGQLAQISDQDMQNFMENQDLPSENAADSVSLIEVNVPQSFTENEISDLMSNVSDDELEYYYASNESQDSNLN